MVNSAKSGNRESFDQLVERYFGLVYTVAFSRLRHRESAEDLAQEVFLRVYLHLDKVHEPALIAGWLVRVTRNLAIDWLRRGNRQSALIPMVPLDEIPLDTPDINGKDGRDQMIEQDRNKALQSALFRLPEDQREMVLLHYSEGLNKKEIAKYLSVHPSTVGRQLKQAVKTMQASLAPILQETAPLLRPPRKVMLRTLAIISATAVMSAQSKAALVTATGGTAWIPAISQVSSGSLIKSIFTAIFKKETLVLIGKGVAVIAVRSAVFLGVNKYLHRDTKSANARPAAVAGFGTQAPNNNSGTVAAAIPSNQPSVAVAQVQNQPEAATVTESAPSSIQPEKDNSILAMATTTATQLALVASDTNQQNNNFAVYLLDKYAENQDKLLKFMVKYEETFDNENYDNSTSKRYQISECRYVGDSTLRDGNRFKLRELEWGNIYQSASEYCPKEKASYRNIVYDGKLWLQYFADINNTIKKNAFTYISPHPTLINVRTVQFRHLGLLMGYMEGDYEERVDSILRKAKSLKVREKPELINGSSCFVIEGITRKGKYTLWLDPDHGYNIAKAVVERGPGDVYFYDMPPMTKTRVDLTLQDIRFEKIDNHWVPMEVTAKYGQYPDGNQFSRTGNWKYTVHHKNIEIMLNPDLTNAFVPDPIPDGTRLVVSESTKNVPKGMDYIWKNGKPCDKNGNPLDFSE